MFDYALDRAADRVAAADHAAVPARVGQDHGEQRERLAIAGLHQLAQRLGGNPVCCAAAYAAIRDLIENKWAENAAEVGAYFREQARTLPYVKEVRGQGLMNAIECSIKMEDKKARFVEEGLLITEIGKHTLRAVPPFIAQKKHVDEAIRIMKSILSEE